MKKKECPSCAVEVDENAATCPICNFEFPSRVRLQWIALLLLALFITILIYGLF